MSHGVAALAAIAVAAVVMLGWRGAASLRPPRLDTVRDAGVDGPFAASEQGQSGDRRAGVRWRRFALGRRPPERGPSDVDVANWCDDMARALRSGSSITTALADSGVDHPAVASLIGPVIVQLGRGRSLVEALHVGAGGGGAAQGATAGGLALTVTRTCAELGGPAARPLERLAATLRARDALRQEQMAHSAQAQMSARVMTLVPVGMLALLASTDPQVRAAVGSPAGLAAVTVGAGLNLAGWWWMQHIIGRPR